MTIICEGFDRFSPEDLHRIAHMKRFKERYEADASFRAACAADMQQAVTRYGLDVDPDVMVLWMGPDASPALAPEDGDDIALILAYREIVGEISSQGIGVSASYCSVYSKWRQRQIVRDAFEEGKRLSRSAMHLPFAAELSQGCSVGCWFCSLGAQRLEKTFAYTPENARLWKGVLHALNDIFGLAEGGQQGLCYWGTDPLDNPDYERFLDDYRDRMGQLPQTTTAVAMRDVQRTRALLARYGREHGGLTRFSVLSLPQLEQIHEAFSPEELLLTKLVIQTKDSLAKKAIAGRVRERLLKYAPEQDKKRTEYSNEQGTTSCVSGFLINIVKRHVQLISPCTATERWPLGHRTYDEGSFENEHDFRQLLESMIRRNMPETLPSDAIAAFHPGLDYERLATGFRLSSAKYRITVDNPFYMGWIGDLVREGCHTTNELVRICVSKGLSETEARQGLQTLFDAGVLHDEPDLESGCEPMPKAAVG
jgi:radical SAM family RiPP maturation amino acid epimerase